MPCGKAGGQNIEHPHTLVILSSFFFFFFFLFCFKCILVLLVRRSSGELRCSGTALIFIWNEKALPWMVWKLCSYPVGPALLLRGVSCRGNVRRILYLCPLSVNLILQYYWQIYLIPIHVFWLWNITPCIESGLWIEAISSVTFDTWHSRTFATINVTNVYIRWQVSAIKMVFFSKGILKLIKDRNQNFEVSSCDEKHQLSLGLISVMLECLMKLMFFISRWNLQILISIHANQIFILYFAVTSMHI